MPNPAVATTPIARASQKSRPAVSTSHDVKKAPKASSSPWAKLMTRLARKMTVKPSATRAYTEPRARPAKRSWAKVVTRPPGSPRHRGAGRQVQGLAEVGPQHVGVGLDLGGRTGGDDPPEVEDHHPVGQAHDDAHVVFDQQDRHRGFVPVARLQLGD